MLKTKTMLKRAIDFHGHFGPYLVLGMLMGDLAINKLRCKRHFGIKAIVKGAVHKPKSCLIDGIQVSTGCTYGKGNIIKLSGSIINTEFINLRNNKKIEICLKKDLVKRLDSLDGHRASKSFAGELLKINPVELFEFKF